MLEAVLFFGISGIIVVLRRKFLAQIFEIKIFNIHTIIAR